MAIAMRTDPLHRAFFDRHFLYHGVFGELVDVMDLAMSTAAILATVVTRGGALAGRFATPALLADGRDAGNAKVFAFANILVLDDLFRGTRNMADGDKAATALRAAVAAAVATGFSTASGFSTAGFAPESERLSNQRTRDEDGESDQSKGISFHV